ncbi:hypothetical protein HO133_002706 [Letharia lupina]|uniref:Uncharacterized protein n=1 Tax=Letharia lupina TaxID=560253 RepID=A0A8H6CCG5_9LECA|nr:uncharacterized protein HO133_002706 [Letharia lupina]KAF6221025.1 hypothetical protein HO133_002706 [Letharia lupina]
MDDDSDLLLLFVLSRRQSQGTIKRQRIHNAFFPFEMFDNNNKGKDASAFSTHEPGWVNIDLEPHCAEATVIGQGPGWKNFDLEARTPSKKRLWRGGRTSKIVVGVAVVAMFLTAILVPTVVGVMKGEGKGKQ